MAPYTYYYCTSLIFVITIAYWIVDLVHIRIKRRALFGTFYKPSSPEYKRLIRLARKQTIAASVVIEALFIANLLYSIHIIAHLGTKNAKEVLIFAPIAIALLFALGFVTTKNRIVDYTQKRHD